MATLDAFVTKLDAAGAALVYSTYLGGAARLGQGVAVDASGSAYVTGCTSSSDFPTTAGAFDTSVNGSLQDAFVTKLDAAGAALAYSTYLGGSGGDDGTGRRGRRERQRVCDGLAPTRAISRRPPARSTRAANGDDYPLRDAFVTKLDAAGAALAYSTYLGGSGDDQGHGVAVDASGSAYVTGCTGSSDFPTTAGAFDTSWNYGQRRLCHQAGCGRRDAGVFHLPGRHPR